MTLNELFIKTKEAFRNGNIPCAEHEAELLLCRIMRVDRTHLILFGEIEARADRAEIVEELTRERLTGRPLQYILGLTDFMGYDIKVDERVLIPRPETELLVETAVEEIRARGGKQSVHDLCTGSGIIAGIVAAQCPECEVSASDISEGALELARLNCDIISPENPVSLYRADLLADLPLSGRVDILLTNPPYIPTEVIGELQAEVRDHEPRIALDGGKDGLEIPARILAQAPAFMKEGGLLLMEIGYDQGDAVSRLAAAAGFAEISILKDLEGHDRILKCSFRQQDNLSA